MKEPSSPSRICLITGSTRGLGLEAARQLLKLHYHVLVSGRDAKRLTKTHAALQKEFPSEKVGALLMDVSSDKSVKKAFESLSEKFGRLDVLINNAGIFLDQSDRLKDKKGASIFNTPISLIQETIETNTLGALRALQHALPLMKQTGYGRIVNVSSGMGQLSEMNGKWPGYRISKTALNAITAITAAELHEEKETGILINSVCPGWVQTDMGGPDAERTPEEGVQTIVWLATLDSQGPTGRFFRDKTSIAW